MSKQSWDEYYMEMLPLIASRSPDENTKVGCIIVIDKRIVSTGYNGHLSDLDTSNFPANREKTERFPLAKYPVMIHAEMNAITDAARRGISLNGGMAYISACPCLTCLQALWQSGVRKIVYPKDCVTTLTNEENAIYYDLIRASAGEKLIIKTI